MKKITESTKVTLTLGQLKKLVKESVTEDSNWNQLRADVESSSLEPEEIWEEYLSSPEDKVMAALGLFSEPSTQGGIGEMVFYDEKDRLGLPGPIVMDYRTWSDDELELALASRTADEFRTQLKEYMETLIQKAKKDPKKYCQVDSDGEKTGDAVDTDAGDSSNPQPYSTWVGINDIFSNFLGDDDYDTTDLRNPDKFTVFLNKRVSHTTLTKIEHQLDEFPDDDVVYEVGEYRKDPSVAKSTKDLNRTFVCYRFQNRTSI